MGQGINVTPRPLYFRERGPLPICQDESLEAKLDGCKKPRKILDFEAHNFSP
jgi:hypothetical protein